MLGNVKLLGRWVVAVVVVGHVATGEVVTELKGILPEVHLTVVLILINFNLLSTNDEKYLFILYIVFRFPALKWSQNFTKSTINQYRK